MESSLDSVDNIPFQTPDQLKPVQRSEKDKQRKFSKALKEKMEEELHEGGKEHRQDEFVHDDDNRQTPESKTTGTKEAEDENKSGTRPEDDPTKEDSSPDRRIDLKA